MPRGFRLANIETAAATLDWSVLFDFDPVRSLPGGIGPGVVPGERLEDFLRQQIPMSIERFPVPFAAVAADMEQGEVVALNQGNAARAVLASCAVPGLYAPVRARGRLLADGQVVSPLPVLTARSLGAVRVLAVDVVYPPQHSEMSNPISMLFQSTIVSGWRHAHAERAIADLVITPEIRTPTQLGLASRAWVTEAGERSASARRPGTPQRASRSSAPRRDAHVHRWALGVTGCGEHHIHSLGRGSRGAGRRCVVAVAPEPAEEPGQGEGRPA